MIRLQLEEDKQRGVRSRDGMKKFDQNEFNAQAGTFVVDAVLGSCSYVNYRAVA